MPKTPPVVFAGVAGVVQLIVTRGATSSKASIGAGVLLGAASTALGAAAVSNFHAGGTTIDPVEVQGAQTLVTRGPYAFTRNPMYLGITGALLSFAVARRSVGAVLPVAGFMVAMNFLQIPREERALSQIFGTDYGQYLQRVPRWLGPVNRPVTDTITN